MDEKQTQLRALQRRISRVEVRYHTARLRSDRYARLRLIVFSAGVLLSIAAFLLGGITPFWVIAAINTAVFITLVVIHRRINTAIHRYNLWLRHQRAQVARMQLDWPHIPRIDVRTPNRAHPFAADLDLIGERSIHHLLNTAVSVEGSQRLADWLTQPQPDMAAITQRQQLVRELAPMTYFRDRLVLNSLLAADNPEQPWQPSALLDADSGTDDTPSLRRTLLIMAVLATLTILLFALNALGVLPPFWAATWPIYTLIFVFNTSKIKALFDTTFTLESTLRRLRQVFGQLEQWNYPADSALRRLCSPFIDPAERPSQLLKRVTGVLAGASLQGNLFLWLPVNLLIPWDFYFAYRLRQCQAELRARAPQWLRTWFDLEAAAALANYSALNPTASFPSFSNTGVPFHATALGHPLIPDDVRVCNDFTLARLGDVALITGSNMSGKSSFLRTLGVNLCLAFAGGPVCAATLDTHPFRLFTSIALSDSVIDGISYFYAEVKRLKQLLDALRREDSLPLFFLIDEIFRGTNNRERLIGSRAYVRALADRHGIGVISTHDLELTRLTDEVPAITNYHFTEHLADGHMIFDYLLRPGPSPSTNALRIMQLEGLPVDTGAIQAGSVTRKENETNS